MARSLHGRAVLITGAARGIGAETARRLAARGARLALVGLEPERLAALTAELGPAHAWSACDVTDPAALDAAVAEAVDALGGLDVVVANAGIAGRGTLATEPVESLVRTIEVNLVGAALTAKATLPALAERRGHLLLVASASSFVVLPGLAAYGASKAGVEQLGNALRMEVAHRGVTVGTAHPSWIDTDLLRGARADLPAFDAALPRLPWPFGTTTSVEACADALVAGIARRRRKVYVPRSLVVVQALRTVLNSPLGQRAMARGARLDVPGLEAQARALRDR